MINRIYRLTGRKKIEEVFVEEEISINNILIRPNYLSICEADQRYYQFDRAMEILEKKLPMALIHEAIGKVIYDPKGEFLPGEDVVLIPGLPRFQDDVISENYLGSSLFRSSNYDGFLQEIINQPRDRVLRLPKHLVRPVMAYVELMSVCIHAIEKFIRRAHHRRENVGIWGDGNLGFILALFLKEICPEIRLHVVGKHSDKLEQFVFVDEVHLITDNINHLSLDHAFECVGGPGSQKAINQIIDCINPEGYIALLGVSEDVVEINTRMVLEKGLMLVGNSRSTIADYETTVRILDNNQRLIGYLENIISSIQRIKSLDDIRYAFESDRIKSFGKTVMKWKI